MLYHDDRCHQVLVFNKHGDFVFVYNHDRAIHEANFSELGKLLKIRDSSNDLSIDYLGKMGVIKKFGYGANPRQDPVFSPSLNKVFLSVLLVSNEDECFCNKYSHIFLFVLSSGNNFSIKYFLFSCLRSSPARNA